MTAYLKNLFQRFVARLLQLLRLKTKEVVVPTVDAVLQGFIAQLEELQKVAEHHDAVEAEKNAEAMAAKAQAQAANAEASRARSLAERFANFIA